MNKNELLNYKSIKWSFVPYFSISLWSFLFGGGFIFAFFYPTKEVKYFGQFYEATFFNKLPFLLIGLLVMSVFVLNLFYSYWLATNQDGIVIKNLFKRNEILYSEIKSIKPTKRIPFPMSNVETIDYKRYYVHLSKIND